MNPFHTLVRLQLKAAVRRFVHRYLVRRGVVPEQALTFEFVTSLLDDCCSQLFQGEV